MSGVDLVSVINREHTDDVLQAIKQGADINASRQTSLPLQTAASLQDVAILELLLSYGADVNSIDGKGRTALHYAAENSISCLRLLLKYDADPNVTDCNGCSPLHWAASKGKADCVKCLLQSGADVNHQNVFGETALFWAARRTCLHVVRTLLEYNADPCLFNQKMELSLDKSLLVFYLGFETNDDTSIVNLLTEAMGYLPFESKKRVSLRGSVSSICSQLKINQLLSDGVSSLKRMCRYKIRLSCGKMYLPTQVMKLPISDSLKRYLLLNES